MKEVHRYAAFIHGMLTALHIVGIVYNVRRRNRLDTVVHGAAMAYSLHATFHH